MGLILAIESNSAAARWPVVPAPGGEEEVWFGRAPASAIGHAQSVTTASARVPVVRVMLSSLFYGLSGQLRRMPSLCQARSRCASGSCVVTRVPVLSLLVSNTTPGEYFQLFLFAGFAPT